MKINIKSPAWDNQESGIFVHSVQHALDVSSGSAPQYFQVISSSTLDESHDAAALNINMVEQQDLASPTTTLRPHDPALEVHYGSQQDSTFLAKLIADEVHGLFSSEQQRLRHLLSESPYAIEGQYQPDQQVVDELDKRTTRSFKYASTYHLTFSLFTSSSVPSEWDIEAALARNIAPLLESFKGISNFTIDTQVQLHASFSPSIAGPQYAASSGKWELQKSDLSGFINAAEWPLSPSIGTGPTINFVLYVPSKEHRPLVIAETGGNSWLIPQWGGVQILNDVQPSKQAGSGLTADDLQPVMLTFADQLVSLLGLPQTPPSLPMRLSSLTRQRATSLILSASSTLGALARLSLKLTSIAIPDSVATSVDQTLHHLEVACLDLREGRYHSALENARIAEAEAEEAFFEPSMVGQVYFPDEHKVAVYVPLLGPMAVPLVMAAIKELRKLRKLKLKSA